MALYKALQWVEKILSDFNGKIGLFYNNKIHILGQILKL